MKFIELTFNISDTNDKKKAANPCGSAAPIS